MPLCHHCNNFGAISHKNISILDPTPPFNEIALTQTGSSAWGAPLTLNWGKLMKKVLFTTTALVASASFAAAEVSLSGYAEMGLVGGDAIDLQFHQDLDVTFSMSGESDGGLTFGASVDIDETTAGTNNSDDHGTSVFISGAFGTLTLGDTDGAFDKALTETGMGSAIADDHTTHAGYNGNSGLDGSGDGQVLRYDYSFGDFAVAISAEQGDTDTSTTTGANLLIENDDAIFGIGASFGTDLGGTAIGVGLGYQTQGNVDIMGVSLSAGIAGFDVVVNYRDHSVAGDSYGIGLGYTMDAVSVSANYGENAAGVAGYGATVNYDLGGGATVMAGYGDSDVANSATYSLGLGLSF